MIVASVPMLVPKPQTTLVPELRLGHVASISHRSPHSHPPSLIPPLPWTVRRRPATLGFEGQGAACAPLHRFSLAESLLVIDPFRLCLALGPVAVYMVLVGAVNLFRRPLLVSGTRDTAALGLAVSGLILVGPIELFVPVEAVLAFGSKVWIFLILLYVLVLVLVLLMSRPRLVIYNVTIAELRPALADVAAAQDDDARWAGDSLVLPNLGVRLHMECVPAMRNVSLVSSGPQQSYLGWRRLERALGTALSRVEVSRNPRGFSLASAGVLLGVALMMLVARDPHAVFESLASMFQLAR